MADNSSSKTAETTTETQCRLQQQDSVSPGNPPNEHTSSVIKINSSFDSLDASFKGIVQASVEERPVDAGVVDEVSEIVLYYSSDWIRPRLHYSLNGASWTDTEFSQLQESDWKMVRLDVGARGEKTEETAALLEFVITDGDGCWDKPQSGGNYVIAQTGIYAIRESSMEVLKTAKPVLVVSDLDGTMIGDDASTRNFKSFWNRHAALTKSILVYNTGRSLESFLKLLEEKKNCMEVPVMLISAVGTKIYTHLSGSWKEDEDWVHQLNQDWNLEVVRLAAESALDAVGDDNMHFRPEEEQNEHKITCGVRSSFVDDVVKRLEEKLKQAKVEANVIVSGIGDWRFLDVVSKNAGKLEALNYVRKRYGFAESATVACGDSGNDILMLSGSNLAVVVGNAQPDLLEWVQGQRATQSARLYLAKRHEALGILEGLKHFEFT